MSLDDLVTAPGPRGEREASSFRDPTGFVYRRDGTLYRQLNRQAADDWDHFGRSGLYRRLVERGWLIEHHEAPLDRAFDDAAWLVLQPEPLGFVSYPYEWTFGQLRDAALLTLDIQAAALDAGMTLKDGSAYNVQFHDGRPVFIDALSFERRAEDEPWSGYRQFCQHFLAPLSLMALRDPRCGLLLRDFVDGIPLDLAVRLLPGRSRLNLGLAAHLHLHARAQREHGGTTPPTEPAARPRISPGRMEALISNLRAVVDGLRWEPTGTEWADYGETTSYSELAAASKARLVEWMLGRTEGDWVWDLGANTGAFSELAARLGRRVVSLDADPAAAERHYRRLRGTGATHVLPLVVDLANPSPALGWANRERKSITERANADTLLALALVHHLAIGNNVPLANLAEFLATLGRQLVIEFVPKSDPRVRAMLAHRRDVFDDYSYEGFRAAFARAWELCEEQPIEDSERVLVRFERR